MSGLWSAPWQSQPGTPVSILLSSLETEFWHLFPQTVSRSKAYMPCLPRQLGSDHMKWSRNMWKTYRKPSSSFLLPICCSYADVMAVKDQSHCHVGRRVPDLIHLLLSSHLLALHTGQTHLGNGGLQLSGPWWSASGTQVRNLQSKRHDVRRPFTHFSQRQNPKSSYIPAGTPTL